MLGVSIHDPHGVEGPPAACEGLGLLQVHTTLTRDKVVRQVTGQHVATQLTIAGYEIHAGLTTGADTARPVLRLQGDELDGAQTASGQVWGTYVHGLFASDAFRHAFMRSVRLDVTQTDTPFTQRIDGALNELAAALACHVDTTAMLAAAR